MIKVYVLLFVAGWAAPALAQADDAPCIPDVAAAKLLACPAVDTGNAEIDAFATAACYEKIPEELASIRYLQGKRYYDAEQLVEAAALFRHVAVEHSATEVAVFAANLYLDSLNALAGASEDPFRTCYAELAEAVELFADDTKPPGSHLMRDEELRRTVAAIRVQLERKRAEVAFSDERYLEAAEIFLAIASDFPDWYDDQSRCHLLFNAAMALERSHRIGAAIAQYERLIAQYPSCELAGKASFLIGTHYHVLQMYEQAAERYLDFARKYPADEDAPIALSNAITFLIALGRESEALEAVALFDKLYARKQAELTATAVFSSGYIHINNQDWKRVREHYQSYLKRYVRVRLLDEQIQAHVFIGDSYRLQKKPNLKQAREQYNGAAALFDNGAWNAIDAHNHKRKAEMLIAVAKAKFYLAEEKYRAFLAIELPAFKPKKKVPAKVRKWWKEKHPAVLWPPHQALPKPVALLNYLELGRPSNPEDDFPRRGCQVGANFGYGALSVKSTAKTGKDKLDADEIIEREEKKRVKKRTDDLALLEAWRNEREKAKAMSFVPAQTTSANAETEKLIQQIQFEYWLEHSFTPWFLSKSDALREATNAFGEIPSLPITVPEWEMAAAARAGDMQLHMDQELASVPIPPAIAGDEKLEKIYRNAMDDKREMFRQGAIGGYRHCLEVSTKLRWYNELSLHCEAQLNELLPKEYPIAAEIMPAAAPDLSFVDVPGPILERKKETEPNVSDIDPLEDLPNSSD